MLNVVTSSYNNIDDHFYTRSAFVDLKKRLKKYRITFFWQSYVTMVFEA